MGDDGYFAGLDIGAVTTKAAIIDSGKRLVASSVRRTTADLEGSAILVYEEALKRSGLAPEGIRWVTATGFGRKSVSFAQETVTEISCHSRGCYHYFPEEITVVDIGGQDSKITRLAAEGKRVGFKINRKCAAGTGAFLEEMAYRLDIPLGDLDSVARRSSKAAEIGSYCTVFTATEVLDRIRRGEKVEEIVRGLFVSVVKRVLEMGTLSGLVIMTGGVVAYNPIVAELFSQRSGKEVEIAPHPQEMGAFGAALFALERAQKVPLS